MYLCSRVTKIKAIIRSKTRVAFDDRTKKGQNLKTHYDEARGKRPRRPRIAGGTVYLEPLNL